MTNWIIFIIIAVALIAGIEYLSRSFPAPWRLITLGIVVLILVLWLLGLVGLIPMPFHP
jgi:hypothetical protein